VVGAAILIMSVGGADRERRRAMARVQVGDPVQRAVEVTGVEALRCPADSLGHLRASFPDGWPPAAVDVAIETLQAGTAERWLFPLEAREAGSCAAEEGRTEVGVDSLGAVVWFVPLLGSSPLALPPGMAPAGMTEQQVDSPAAR
jgi:hypothetical protein